MNEISRLHFLKMTLASVMLAPGFSLLGQGVSQLRGDRVGWARLKTPSPSWLRHSGSDPVLMRFFREQTTLNIDPTWYAADANELSALCKYPFLFSQGVAALVEPAARRNVAEFVRRGGFLLVDACCDHSVTPNFDEFFRQQIEFFSTTLPEARVELLPVTHEIYRCHFQIPGGHPPHTYMAGIFEEHKSHYGLYGVMIGTRMAGMISFSGLQCGWDRITEHPAIAPAGHDTACMSMLVNIYIYAMMQGN